MKKLITTILTTIALTVQLHSSNLFVTNGDFSDLSALGVQGGGWYWGVPTGWTGVSNYYAVYDTGSNFIANLSQISSTNPWQPLSQNVGLLSVDSDVTLYFDVLNTFSTPNIGVGIFSVDSSGNATALAASTYTTGLNQSLLAANVLAGTDVQIGFWNVAGASAIDNIYVVDAAVIPEPTVLDIATLPMKITSYCVGVISRNIYTAGLNSGEFNSLTILY
jgi:hypothetical protein